MWADMRRRCANPNRKDFKYYGGRGISVCKEWERYSVFREWAMSNGYADNLTIDRINNDGNYEPGNCQLIIRSENSRKDIEKFTAGEVAEIRKIIKHGKYSQRRIADAYGMHRNTVSNMANNKTYKEAV